MDRFREEENLWKEMIRNILCYGCGTGGRVVASDTRDPQFKTSGIVLTVIKIVIKRPLGELIS